MSWAASKAVGPWIQAPRVARLNLRFGIVHYQPRNPARGCIGEPAPVRTRPCDTAQPRARKCSPEKVSPFRKAVQSQLRSFLIETPITKATGCFGGITMHMCPTVVRSEMREIGSLAVFPHHSTGIPGDKRQGEFEATDVLADTCWRACLNCWQGLCACFANCRAHPAACSSPACWSHSDHSEGNLSLGRGAVFSSTETIWHPLPAVHQPV